tara:strand:- start:57 stop:569 length:513 start_codon:yes stop_codon:yes gene_type:complete
MNIFVLDADPEKAAQAMDCVRVPKMVTESAQMMASALLRHGTPSSVMPYTMSGTRYKGGYHRHPCTVWAGDTRMNFMWLATHALALCKEYEQRFIKEHACRQPILHMIEWMDNIPEGDYTPFAQAMPDEFKQEDAVQAYRAYYHSKIHSAGGVHYRHTDPPDWWMGVSSR